MSQKVKHGPHSTYAFQENIYDLECTWISTFKYVYQMLILTKYVCLVGTVYHYKWAIIPYSN